MLDRNVKKRIEENNSDYVLEKLAGQENRFFQGMDIVSANLEGPFANSRRATTKSIAFRFDPALIPMLKKYNFSLLDLANNHALDMSREAFEESKTNLKNAGIDFYGIGYGISDDAYFAKEVGGVILSFVGVDDTLTPVNEEKLLSLIKKGEAESEFTVVNIHWGAEYATLKSNSRQQDLAHQMIDAGADLIIGHHPHVIQEMEIYHNRPIFYSLGNFIFDQYFSVDTQQGLSVGSVFSINEQGQKGISLYVYPVESANSQQGLMSSERANIFMANFIDKSRIKGYNLANFKLKINW
jgi:poly-gamma-glutamate synthesis protein (capsule biosynthesis protein)